MGDEVEGRARARTFAIVIPARDEEPALPGVLARLPRAGEQVPVPVGPPARLEAIVVADNGSRDRTAEVARAGGATVVREPRGGYGAACLAGLGALAGDPPALVVFMDADGSDHPGDLPALLAPLLAGEADLVVGSRALGTVERGALTPPQRFGNWLAARLLRALFGLAATDLGPFRAIRWDALAGLGMRDRDFGWTVEMQARAARAGWRVAEVPVRYRRRIGRSKISGTVRGVLAAGAKILFTIAKVRAGG
jgi:glycosyltransferase involved in cell wall biosynthesis